MKTPLQAMVLGLAISALVGCSTVDSRVKDHQGSFQTWPADVQEKVRAGKIEMGYSMEMVEVALGKPERVASRTTANGHSDVWIYGDKSPKFSIGLGLGSARGSTAMGGGVTLGEGFRDDEAMRVVFEGGKVTAIETRK